VSFLIFQSNADANSSEPSSLMSLIFQRRQVAPRFLLGCRPGFAPTIRFVRANDDDHRRLMLRRQQGVRPGAQGAVLHGDQTIVIPRAVTVRPSVGVLRETKYLALESVTGIDSVIVQHHSHLFECQFVDLRNAAFVDAEHTANFFHRQLSYVIKHYDLLVTLR